MKAVVYHSCGRLTSCGPLNETPSQGDGNAS